MHVVGATVMKADTEIYAKQSISAEPVLTKSELFRQRIADAKLRGYEGVSCPECANFTMVRNGTCLKCDTCGSTSGCS
jgi:ribonucleoside-diphosphate reductase alpha chain